MRYHTTVTGLLQTVARLSKSSPYVAPIVAPKSKAEQVAYKQAKRYPTITAGHATRTALRKARLPAVQLVIFPPEGESVAMLLMSNIQPDGRERWGHVLDPDRPLEWRNYMLATGKNGVHTWRLTEDTREQYRLQLARLITGRGGIPAPQESPYQLPDETARAQVLKLAQHLTHYPGFSGIRSDVYDLAQYSTRVWKSTRQTPYPEWPNMPYIRFQAAPTAPLSELTNDTTNDQNEETHA